MKFVYLGGKAVKLDPTHAIGKGGEADVFDLRDGRALKVWKTPDHPDLTGRAEEQRAAEARLRHAGDKLSALERVRAALPPQVVTPLERATDRSGKNVLGYTMPLVRDAEPLVRFSEPRFRRLGVTDEDVLALFRSLHGVVSAVHRAGVVIGDFNDLNVLVVNAREPRLIDVDSMQVAAYPCHVYTERFCDPRLCDRTAPAPRLARPYDVDADWFAYAALLFQSMVLVSPYGGVHKPRDIAARVPAARRPLERMSVFTPDVQYPRPARSLDALSREARELFRAVFEQDTRGPFPLSLLDRLLATSTALPAAALTSSVVAALRQGNFQARVVFNARPGGVIVEARALGNAISVLHHDGVAYVREDGSVVLDAPLDTALDFALQGARTWLRRSSQLVAVGTPAAKHAIDNTRGSVCANARHAYWVQNGALVRDAFVLGRAESETVGQVLERCTRVWCGDAFGLALSRAGELTMAAIFDADRMGLRDGIVLPRLAGEMIDARAVFSRERAWLFVTLVHQGRARRVAIVIDRAGTVLAACDATPGDGTWLGGSGAMGGACAVGDVLFVATDGGLMRVEARSNTCAVTREFPESAQVVSAGVDLMAANDGIYVVTGDTIFHCTFTSNQQGAAS